LWVGPQRAFHAADQIGGQGPGGLGIDVAGAVQQGEQGYPDAGEHIRWQLSRWGLSHP